MRIIISKNGRIRARIIIFTKYLNQAPTSFIYKCCEKNIVSNGKKLPKGKAVQAEIQ